MQCVRIVVGNLAHKENIMTTTIAGHCGKCGAPYYLPSIWHGVIPPAPTPTCACWNLPQTYSATNICTCGFENQFGTGCPIHGEEA